MDGLNVEQITEMIRKVVKEENSSFRNEINKTIKSTIEASIDEKFAGYDKRITNLEVSLSNLQISSDGIGDTASKAYDTSDANLKNLTSLSTKVAVTENKAISNEKHLETLREKIKQNITHIDELHETIDDLRNRNMRSNLVFKGLPEDENETYDASKNIIAKYISDHLEKNIDEVKNKIIRAHRSKGRKSNDKPRVLFVKFDRDDTAYEYLALFTKINKERKTYIHNVSQQYTESLQSRRNEALKHRRDLLNNDEALKAKVVYPATLKAMYPGTQTFELVRKY